MIDHLAMSQEGPTFVEIAEAAHMTVSTRIAHLKAIRTAAEAVLERICSLCDAVPDGRPDGAINWASISIDSVEFTLDDMGQEGHRIIIRRAAPDGNDELCQAMREGLARAGFRDENELKNLDIVTEW